MGFDSEAPFRKRPTGGEGARVGLSSTCIYSAFKKWAQKHHAFTDVQILSTELEILSPTTQLLLENRKVEGGNKMTVIPVLQWNLSTETSHGGDLKLKSLTVDQKIANTIFLRLLRDVWNDAHNIVLRKFTAESPPVRGRSGERKQKEKDVTKRENNPRSGGTSEGEEKQGGEKYTDIDIVRVGGGKEVKEEGIEECKWDKQKGKEEKLRSTAKCDESKSMQEEEPIFELSKMFEKDSSSQVLIERCYTKATIHLLGIDKLNIMLKEDNDRRSQRKHKEKIDRMEETR